MRNPMQEELRRNIFQQVQGIPPKKQAPQTNLNKMMIYDSKRIKIKP